MALTEVPIELSSTPGIIDNSTGTAITIDASQNVGINGASGGATLQVNQATASYIDIKSDNALRMRMYGDSNQAILVSEGVPLIFKYGTTEAMRIDSSGNVGINATTIAANGLQIGNTSSTDTEQLFLYSNKAIFSINTDGATNAAGTTIAYSWANGGQGPLKFDNATSTVMTLDASGNVGIGTSSPNQKLHISDSAPFVRLESTSTSYNGFTAKNDSGNFYFGIDDSGGTFYGSAYARAIYADGAYPVTFYTNATERMRIDASGNVHIGAGTASTANLSIITSGQSGGIQLNRNTSVSPTSGQSLGSYAFKGVDSANSNASAEAMIEAVAAETHTGSTAATNMIFYTKETGTGPGSAPTPRMTLDASGNLLVGTTSSAGKFTLVSNQYNAMSVQVNADGNVGASWKNGAGSEVGYIQVNTSSTLYSTSSDQRLKDNIVDAPSASDDIDAIQVRSFDWKVDGSHQKYGMVAQELLEVAPSAVSQPEDPEEMMGVDYSKLVPMMLKEIQSLRARVAQLES